MKISIIAFRGTGFRNPTYQDEPGLVRAGHVGIVFEEDSSTIYGFHPTQQAEADAGGIEQLIELLKDHERQPGTVQIDTDVFIRAYELAQIGELNKKTEVLELTYDLPDEVYESARQKIMHWYKTQEEFWYNFPYRSGEFEPGEYNCAVFPELAGIPIPSSDGIVHLYVEAMRRQGATKWKPPES